MTEEFAPFGSRTYTLLLASLVFSRAMDFLSTWLATPRLMLEANPLARRLGWKWGGVVNALVCLAFAGWPLPAVVIATTSLLVAARNLQSAWLMRSLGEVRYRTWMAERVAESSRTVFVLCVVGQSLLVGAVGGALIWAAEGQLIPFGVGTGMVTYAAAVTLFSLLSVWRIWRGVG